MMAGFNGQEGTYFYPFILLDYPEFNISAGLSKEFLDEYLLDQCANFLTPSTPSRCKNFMKAKYQLDKPSSDKQRAVLTTYAMGKQD